MARLRNPIARRVVGLVAAALVGLGVLVAGVAASSSRASAASTTLYSQMNDGAWSVATSSNFWAQSFTTSSTATSLTSVEVWIRNNSGGGSSYSLALYSSSSGMPGSSLTTIKANESVGAWGDGRKSFTLSTPYSLAASTQYFIVMSGPAGGTVGWKCNAAS
ncbi:MAG: choice-of-anchor R domain-containing protein, partial [Acidimicrobiia bacterium]